MCRVGESPPTEFHDCDRSLIAPTCNGVGSLHPSFGGHAHANRTAIVADFLRQDADEYFCSGACLLFTCPAFVRAPRRGFSCALRQLALLLWLRRPAGYGFPPNLVRKERRKDFSGASANAELRHLGAWPTRSTGAPDQDREIPQTETLMYQNKVTVIRSRWSTLCTPRQQPPDRIQHQRASSFRPRLRRHESQLPGPYRRTRSRPRR